jgi:hypothetical protein
MNEAFQRFPDLDCAEREHGCDYHDKFDTSLMYLLRAVHESLFIAESVENLRALMEPKPEMSFHDFDLSNNESIGMKHLQIFSMMKASQPIPSLKYCVLYVLKHPAILKFIKTKEERDFVAEYAVRNILVRNLNTFGLFDRSQNHGAGILPFGTFFNHSCDPNVMKITYDAKYVFIVLKPIMKGEQLFIMYA